MDLSIMYPSPMTQVTVKNANYAENAANYLKEMAPINKLIEANYWPALVNGSNGFLSENLFKRTISPVLGTYSKEFGPSMFRFDQPYRFGNGAAGDISQLGNGILDMSDSKRWRVVSIVFNPCPYETHFKPSFDRLKKCTPEIRLVAQPAMGYSVEEARLADTFPVATQSVGASVAWSPSGNVDAGLSFGDYGMHLFYRLGDSAEAAQVADQLYQLKIKSDCNTTGVPMGPHPCLVSQAKDIVVGRRDSEDSFSTSLIKIIKAHTHSLHRISVWGSTQNAGPWGFYFGEIQNGDFVWKNIPTVVPGTFSPSNSSSPFQAGKAMHYTRGSSINTAANRTRGQIATTIISDTKTLRPDPRPNQDSLQHFLLNQFRFGETGMLENLRAPDRLDDPADIQPKYAANPFLFKNDPKAKPTGRYISDLSQITEKIDNPTINSELNVDCISCHLSKSEGIFARRNFNRTDPMASPTQVDSDQDIPESQHTQTTDHEAYFWQIQNGYDGPKDLSNFTHQIYQTHPRNRFGEVYILNQFSHYFKLPTISSRFVNESSESARFVNQYFLRLPGPFELKCNQDALKMCMLYAGGRNLLNSERRAFAFPYSSDVLPKVEACKINMCKDEYAEWSRTQEIITVNQTQNELAAKLKPQLAIAALQNGFENRRTNLSKNQIENFINQKMNSIPSLEISKLMGLLPAIQWRRIYSSSLNYLESNTSEMDVTIIARNTSNDKENLQLYFGYSSRALDKETNKAQFSVSAAVWGEVKEAQFGQKKGFAILSESTTDLSSQLGNGYVLPTNYKINTIEKGQQIKIYGFNKHILTLEWPNGTREIYGNQSFVPKFGPVTFRHPSHMSETEIYQMFKDEITGK